uniref:Uncharacterized protein n=1 Tax=Lepeophtheirus salmonis TaxID=72036 RepID=A0A0K2V0M0_LEPSM
MTGPRFSIRMTSRRTRRIPWSNNGSLMHFLKLQRDLMVFLIEVQLGEYEPSKLRRESLLLGSGYLPTSDILFRRQ